MIRFPCSACGHELQAADGTSTAALLVCDRCGQQVSIPAAQSAVSAATADDEPFRNLSGSSAGDDGELPPEAADDDEIPLAKFNLPDPLPPELKALGDPVRNCPTKSKAPMWLIGLGILALVIGMFMVIALLSKGNVPPGRKAPTANFPCFVFILLPAGIVMICLGWFIDWQARIVVFRKGFAHFKRGRMTVYPYDEIGGVWQAITKHYYNGVYTGTTYNYTVQGNGVRMSINNVYPMVQWLGERIQNEVGNRVFQRSIQALNQHETARFGRLTVSPEGIGCDGTVLPWSEVEKVEIQQGIISVRKQGKWFNWGKVTVAEVPNVFVFIALVDNIIGINTKRR
jgi:hypothetical protein